MKISAVSRSSGVSVRMIRYYEKTGLIGEAVRHDNNYRDYTDADVHRLHFIANARDLGFSVDRIQALLALWSNSARASCEVKALALEHAEELARKIQALEAMRVTILRVAEVCAGDGGPDCPILDMLGDQETVTSPDATHRSKNPISRRA